MIGLRRAIFVSLLVALALASPAGADPPRPGAEACAASFPDRLADARQAILAHRAYMAEYDRVMPWFHEHCRFLTEIEIVARRLNDPNAFVCDTARGRPAGLTSQFVLEHGAEADIPTFQERNGDNIMCAQYDERDRVKLALHNASDVQVLEVLCFEVASPRCDRAREAIASARARAPQQPE